MRGGDRQGECSTNDTMAGTKTEAGRKKVREILHAVR